ncbi:hypothetical protein COV61_01240 [Candidatus Micrarchaeota archaeon CG11_big_fil_rev_8_21_14_0_20_47_5]|nr:MAG: hypothetical protein AUJ17_01195 [Candidatus Micrarchaeota archaeon CG1_02_47_40]PIN84086.1 MAG: hypothetical protein COV61_01240 [Candidatus Micrarchaeota archaeon CG11_big_fil_rev_8_21_14_0_20_47_5]
MSEDYFKKTKEKFEAKIPNYGTDSFRKMRDAIRKGLSRQENEHMLRIRRLKTLLLGDWTDEEKKALLHKIKNTLLENGYYAQTIDNYHDPKRVGHYNLTQILEYCCVNHQLIVFIDGEGQGTLTEQNYLAENYIFHGKMLFFIEESKFNKFKQNPNEYFMSFPAIIRYKKTELIDDVLIYVALRIHRLANIIQTQTKHGRGISNSKYVPWKERLSKPKSLKV